MIDPCREIFFNMDYANFKYSIKDAKEIIEFLEANKDKSVEEIDKYDALKVEEGALEILQLMKRILGEKYQEIFTESYDFDEKRTCNEELKINTSTKIILKNLPVEVKFYDDILEVKTPFVFKRGFGGDYSYPNYLVASFVGLAIQKWLFENEKDEIYFKSYGQKLCNSGEKIVTKIVRRNKNFNHRNVCDNDNIEASRITNAICAQLSIPDTARFMDIYLAWEQCDTFEEEGSYFYIGPKSKIINL